MHLFVCVYQLMKLRAKGNVVGGKVPYPRYRYSMCESDRFTLWYVQDRRVVSVEYQSACPFVGIGPPPPQPPQASVSPPLGPKGEGEQHSLAGEVGPNSDDWTESLALCMFCVQDNKLP